MTTHEGRRLRIGISSCLLGHKVRYDGGHQLDRYIVQTLGHYMDFVPVCPEVECGLPIPREAMRLVGDPENPRLVTRASGVDHTARMREWAARRVAELESERLDGFIFKAKSPSSGFTRIKVYPESKEGSPSLSGVGVFARAFMEHFPLLPVEDDGRLHDPALRENFIERLFVMSDWQDFLDAGPDLGGLVEFHARRKLQLMAHSPKHYQELGRLVAEGKQMDFARLLSRYQSGLMEALALKATVKKHRNVLQHILGYFKNDLTSDEKAEALELVDRYAAGYVPLVVPLTLLGHFVRKYGEGYLARQTYLHPHPVELALRNYT